MQFVAVLAILAISANFCLAQDGEEPPEGGFVLPNGEEVGENFENSVSSDKTRPSEGLSDEDISNVARQLESGDIDSFAEDRAEGDDTVVPSRDELVAISDPRQVNLYLDAWQEVKATKLACCPATQNYQCRVNKIPLTSFFQLPHGWCYPLQSVIYVKCNCDKCVNLCKDCVSQGKCLEKYKFQSFVAHCWKGWWVKPVHFIKYIPYSCYCNAPKCK